MAAVEKLRDCARGSTVASVTDLDHPDNIEPSCAVDCREGAGSGRPKVVFLSRAATERPEFQATIASETSACRRQARSARPGSRCVVRPPHRFTSASGETGHCTARSHRDRAPGSSGPRIPLQRASSSARSLKTGYARTDKVFGTLGEFERVLVGHGAIRFPSVAQCGCSWCGPPIGRHRLVRQKKCLLESSNAAKPRKCKRRHDAASAQQ